jgi:hypothetical protein
MDGARAFRAVRGVKFIRSARRGDVSLLFAVSAQYRLVGFADDVFELGFVFDFAAGAGLGIDHTGGFGLSYAVAGVRLHGLGDRKFSWLAFGHSICLVRGPSPATAGSCVPLP